jgi:hypothetical protein
MKERKIPCFELALLALLRTLEEAQIEWKKCKPYSRKLLIFSKEIKKCKARRSRSARLGVRAREG